MSLTAIVAMSAASGGRWTPPRPTLSYQGSGTSNMGRWTVANYDPTLIYTVGGSGSLSVSGGSATLIIASSQASASLTARSPKGLVQSASITAERRPPTQSFVATGPAQCYYSGSCASQCGGCGTFYAQDQWNPNDGSPAGFYACCAPGSFQFDFYSGYNWSGSNYTNGAGEWWRTIT